MSMQFDMYEAMLKLEQARKEDRDELKKLLERVKPDPNAISVSRVAIFTH